MFKDLLSNSHSDRALVRIQASLLTVSTLFLFFFAQVIGAVLVVIILLLTGSSEQQTVDTISDSTYIKSLTIVVAATITIGVIYKIHKYLKQPFLRTIGLTKKFKKEYFGYSLISYFLYAGVFIATATLISTFLPAIDVDQTQQLGFNNISGFELAVVYLSLVLLPAFLEEIVFRGFLFGRLQGILSLRSAALVSSIVFGLLHLEFLGNGPLNWIAAVDTFILSIFLIGLYVQTKSLWAPVILHTIKNSVAFVFLFVI